ncbi:hypothetical protein CYMTET_11657, partial [Cymbomonas tetramitiformis]
MHRRAFGAREKLSSSKLKLIVMLMPERDEQASSGSENNSTEVEADNIYIYSQTLQRIDIIHRALASVDLDGSFLQGWSVNVSAIDCQCIAPLHGAEEVAPQYGEISFEHRGVTEYDEITFQNRYHVIIGGLCQRRLPDNVTRLQQQLSWKISPGCTSASPSFSNRRILRDLGATNSTLIILSCTPASARQLLERASTHELLHGGRTPATWLLDEWSSAELLLRGALSGLHGVENVEGLQRMADMGPSGISFVADWDPIHPGFLHDHGALRNLSDLQSVLLSDTAYALAHAMRAVGGASPAWGSAGALSLPLGEALQRVSFPGATGHVSFVPGGRMRCGGEVWRVRGLPASDGGGPVQRLALLHAGGCGSDKAQAKTHADGRSKIAGDSEVHVSGSPDAARRGSAYHLPAQRGSGEAGGVHTADGGGEGATVTEQRSTMATGSVHGVTAEPGRQSGRRRRLAQGGEEKGWWGRGREWPREDGGAVTEVAREDEGSEATGSPPSECIVPCTEASLHTMTTEECIASGPANSRVKANCLGYREYLQPNTCFPGERAAPRVDEAGQQVTVTLEYNSWLTQNLVTELAAIYLTERFGVKVIFLDIASTGGPQGGVFRVGTEVSDAILEFWPRGKEAGLGPTHPCCAPP